MPLVLRGSDLGTWVNNSAVPISQIYLYRYNGPNASPKFSPLRFQIDKRRKTNLLHNIFNYTEWHNSPCGSGSGLCVFTDLCALTYIEANQTRCETWDNKPDVTSNKRKCQPYQDDWAKNYLVATDEIVVMARDLAGSQRDDCSLEWLDDKSNPGLATTRQEIEVIDNGDVFYVYAFQWTQPPPANDPDLVAPGAAPSFMASASCTPCSPPYGSNNAENICGTVRSDGATASSLPGYTVNLASNWLVDNISKRSSSVEKALVQELGMKAQHEDHRNWSCNNAPRKHGTITSGKVRFIRSIQGAQSGWGTVRIDKGYDTLFETELELRLHDLQAGNPTMFLNQVHTDDVAPSSSLDPPFCAVWSPDQLALDPPTYFDRVHPDSLTYPSATIDKLDPDRWTQLSVANHAGIATFMTDDPRRGGVNADSQGTSYQDTPTVHGLFGRTWTTLSCMQDGFDNDGGCDSDPESLSLRFRRMWYRMFTMDIGVGGDLNSNLVKADDQFAAATSPSVMKAIGNAQVKDTIVDCGGGGGPFCSPTIGASMTGEGETDLWASFSSSPSGCDPAYSVAFGLTRQISGGPEELIGVVSSGQTFRDVLVKRGLLHTYRSYGISRSGTTSVKSAPLTITPNDTAAPPAPALSVTPLDHGAQVDFEACIGTRVSGANIYVSTSNGGPYNKVNATPVAAMGATRFTVSGLQNNVVYYIVAKLIDHAGNLSPYSAQVSVSPHP